MASKPSGLTGGRDRDRCSRRNAAKSRWSLRDGADGVSQRRFSRLIIFVGSGTGRSTWTRTLRTLPSTRTERRSYSTPSSTFTQVCAPAGIAGSITRATRTALTGYPRRALTARLDSVHPGPRRPVAARPAAHRASQLQQSQPAGPQSSVQTSMHVTWQAVHGIGQRPTKPRPAPPGARRAATFWTGIPGMVARTEKPPAHGVAEPWSADRATCSAGTAPRPGTARS